VYQKICCQKQSVTQISQLTKSVATKTVGYQKQSVTRNSRLPNPLGYKQTVNQKISPTKNNVGCQLEGEICALRLYKYYEKRKM